jgi:hypothetical protein
MEAFFRKQHTRHYYYGDADADPLTQAVTPLETAIASHTDLVQLVVALGATVNRATVNSLGRYTRAETRRSFLDWVQFGIAVINKQLREEEEKDKVKGKDSEHDANLSGWKAVAAQMQHAWNRESYILDAKEREEKLARQKKEDEEQRRKRLAVKAFFADVERLLVSKGAKTYNEVYPDSEHKSTASLVQVSSSGYPFSIMAPVTTALKTKYYQFSTNYSRPAVHMHLNEKYDELYEAAYMGDNETVQRLCLPPEGTTSDGGPLQITVEAATSANEYQRSGM